MFPAVPLFFSLCRLNVDGSQLSAVLRIGLSLERDLLSLVERLEAFHLNGGKMYEHVVTAVVVGNKAVALLRIKPLYRTAIHLSGTSVKRILYTGKN